MPGVLAYGAYVPYHRLDRADIGKSLGSGGGKGARAVASYDEDSTSLGVEAARIALQRLPQPRRQPGSSSCTSRRPHRPTWTRRTPPCCMRRCGSTSALSRWTWSAPSARVSAPSWPGRKARRRPSSCCPTSAPACRAAPTSATVGTALRLSGRARGSPSFRCSPNSSRPHLRPRSSWTAGASRATWRRGHGRRGSARRSTCHSPKRPLRRRSSRPISRRTRSITSSSPDCRPAR